MPIRINLLAEAQAAEELRRRDPVKRAIWGAFLTVVLVLFVSVMFGIKTISKNSTLNSVVIQCNLMTNQYNLVISNQNRLRDIQYKLTMLNHYAAGRFLYASPLDALQRAVVDNIRLMKLRFEQTFEVTPEVAATTNPETGQKIPGHAGGSKEKIALFLQAKDSSDNPGGEQIGRLQHALAANSYFQDEHITTNRIKLLKSEPALYDQDARKLYVTFDLECLYADRLR
jgi:hypothetical protein